MVKLSPNVTDIAEMARVCEGEGADAIAAVNTLQALDVDVETRRSRLAGGLGGLSGPAIRPVAVRMVWQCARAVAIPVCGIGGIVTAEDALQFLLVGARSVQVGTANYLNPFAAVEVVEGLEAYCRRHGVARLADLIGAVEGLSA
jgi:dihydroorotate dehydrogenase (NAD+) catalytic subunit